MASTEQVALWPFWMIENLINYFGSIRNFYIFLFLLDDRRSLSRHFRSMCNFFLNFVHKIATAAILDDQKSLSITFLTISDQYGTFFNFLFSKWLPAAILFFPSDAKNHKDLVIWDLNGYGEYEFDWCICDKVMACTIVGVKPQSHWTRCTHGESRCLTVKKMDTP